MQNENDEKVGNNSKELVSNKETKEDTPIDNTDKDGSEDPGSELDTIREYNRKQNSEKGHPKPQSEETLNPDLTTENDI